MITADYRVLLDACVLVNHTVCDLLLRLGEEPRQFTPLWSEEILDEVHRTQINSLGWPASLANYYRREVTQTFPYSSIEGYETLVPAMTNHPKDRHVLAATIFGQSDLILTFNLKDFPTTALAPHKVSVQHPQQFLLALYELYPVEFIGKLVELAMNKNLSEEEAVLRLGKSVPDLASRLYGDLKLGA